MANGELNLDVSSQEEARAVHRVVRAMHDGHCPKCSYLGTSQDFEVQYAKGPGSLRIMDHKCPNCGFRVTHRQAAEALRTFQPYMTSCVAVFEAWASRLSDASSDKAS